MSSGDCDSVNNGANFFSTVQKPFPNIEDGKINTLEFIDAAKGVVTLVEKLGTVFAPVKYDMNGNVEKILKRYDTDVIKNGTLHDMALTEKAEGVTNATEALLWLTRALHFIELFLEEILNEATETLSETITKELAHAYSLSVKPYHGWVTQKLFTLVIRMCPTRSQFFTSLEMTDRSCFFKDVEFFTQRLRENRMEIQNFYATHKLGNTDVV